MMTRLLSMLCGTLSPWHGMSSGCGWRRQSPDMKVTENVSNKQSQSIRGGPPAWGLDKGANNALP